MKPYVEINRLWVTYGPVVAVKGISFAIPRGEVFGFIGPNGAGKSSTIKVLATLITPDSGQVYIDGINVEADPTMIRKKIGYVPDFFGIYDDLTVREYLHFFASAYRIAERQREQTIGDVLTLTELTAKIESPVDALSRGMKQRLALARVLLHDPEFLLLDEPASGLDPRARIEIRELLVALKEMGKTILISSHILHELSHLCTRIGIIEAGEMVTEGSLEEIYRKLGVKQTVQVQLSNLDEALVAGIRAISGVEEVEPQTEGVVIRVRPEQISSEDLLDSLHALGARIRSFQPEAMDMETVFMKLTEGRTA